MKTEHVIALVAGIREKSYRFIIQELEAHGIAGLVPSHGAILNVLFQQDQISMAELAQRIDRDKSTVTALVKKLVAAGYVAREKDPDDNRITYVSLTKKGAALQPDFDDISKKLIERAYQGFSTEDKEAIIRGLEKMFRNW